MEFLISFLVISIVGTLLHFVYEWSNHNKIVSLFAAVNESTWEHIKIALTPMFLWGLYDGYVYGFSPNYFLAKSISLLAVIIIIPLLFYGYKLITKNSIEEKIYDLQKRKEVLIDSMLSTNQTFISKLSKEDIMNLFE